MICGVLKSFRKPLETLRRNINSGGFRKPLTLIRVAIKKSVAGRLKVIYDPHIVQWQAGFLCGVRCLCVHMSHTQILTAAGRSRFTLRAS
jgi:hypothetical protein